MIGHIPVDADYEVGQIWAYKTRPGEEASRLYICRIDRHEKIGRIFHIFVDGLKIKNDRVESGCQQDLPHAPVDASTLDASVTALLDTVDDVPDVSEGYETWKEDFDTGEGGVFNIPVARIIEYIDSVIDQ